MQFYSLFGIRYCATDYAEATALIIRKALQPDLVWTPSDGLHELGGRPANCTGDAFYRSEYTFNRAEGTSMHEALADAPFQQQSAYSGSASGFAVSALAVHGLIEGYNDPVLKQKINTIDLVVPDGQPIRWALNYFFKAGLQDRVYGPTLTTFLLKAAAEKGIPVFFYGSTAQTIERLEAQLPQQFPGLKLAGMQADRFRESTEQEKEQDREVIRNSGARLVFVGRGCPRQEHWVADNKDHLNMPLIAVGAAFDFLAGNFSQAPAWMQRKGLEWLYRLIKEPGRLWKRYLFTNSQFVFLFLLEALKKPFRKAAF